ncbi:MAG TPA: YoaK family protein [Acidimicrobiales bacterium]
MSDESPPRITGPLLVAVALTAAAGFVDAHLFLHVVQVFVANMSGNVVLMGMSIGDGHWSRAGMHLLSITLFTVGVAGGTVVHDRRRASGRPLRPDLVLACEAVLLVAVIALRVIEGPTTPLSIEGMDIPVIALGALAMGLQTVVIGRVGSVAVATTYESGAVARVGEEAALASRAPENDHRARHLRVVQVLGAVVVAYAAGAAFAAAVGASPAWLLVPLAVVGAVAVRIRQSSARMP